MHSIQLGSVALAVLSASSVAAESVVGVYVFHRHGDRTTKAYAPTILTPLGAQQVHDSGSFFRSRYVSSGAVGLITGISTNNAVAGQLSFTSPAGAPLYDSAVAFTQGFYPPTGMSQTLANGTNVTAPLGGYQYIPVTAVAAPGGSSSSNNEENDEWLQGSSNCPNAIVSSKNYMDSSSYMDSYRQSEDFYQKLLPIINNTYNASAANFMNSYPIYDYIYVSTIHNSSIPSDNLLTNATMAELFTLASTNQWNLAYNATDPVRAIAGSVLAGQVVGTLEELVNGTKGATKFNAQFGSYNVFSSFFGLANLTNVSPLFYEMVNYASSITFELVTNATKPTADDISVRFYFANGTASHDSFQTYPLFGQKDTTLPWSTFKTGMQKFAIADTAHWCQVCGNKDSECASSNKASSDGNSSSGNGISKAVCGVIGAMVTLGVILGLETLIMLFGGLRVVRKSSLQTMLPYSPSSTEAKAQ